MDPRLRELLKRVQSGERFFRPANESDDTNIAFKSEVNRLRELSDLGYIKVSEKGFIKNFRNGKGYYNLVGPCEITYKGEQFLEEVGETTSLSVNTPSELLRNENLSLTEPTIKENSNAPQTNFYIWQKRLKDLSDNINQDLELKKQYEDLLRLEDDPKRSMKHKNEIQNLNASALRYQEEYEALERLLSGGSLSRSQSVTADMENVHEKLDALLSGQENIHQHINALGRALLDRYDAGEQKILGGIIEKITEAQAQTAAEILNASDNDRISEEEMNATIEAVRQSLVKIEAKGKTITPEQKKLVETVSAPQFSVKHKLKVTVPLIPFLLSYENELELGSGVNLESVWDNLKNKFSKK